MTRFQPLLLMAALAALSALPAGAAKPSNISARVTFAEATAPETFRIRSDGGGNQGIYLDGEDCVQSWYALPKGNFFLRTVRSSSPCGQAVAIRALVLDFSDRVWPPSCEGLVEDRYGNTLDTCGVNHVADARLIADTLYSGSATALDIPFSLQPDFRYTAFQLDFVETLAVSVSGAGRTMTAAPTAIAELWQIDGRSKTLLGRYRMPVAATVTPL